MKFSEKLLLLRREHGLSQEMLAEKLDVSRQAVSKWESGQTYPETDKLIALSEIFGVSIDSLIKDGELSSSEHRPGQWAGAHSLLFMGPYPYEYKSKRSWLGLPLLHICFGHGRRAKGVVAIGFNASGIVAFGLMSVGLVSFGLLGVGLISFGVLALGGAALGAISVGAFAMGAVAVGVSTMGAIEIGMFTSHLRSIVSGGRL